MAFERLKEYRKVRLDLDISGAMTLEVYTDLPGEGMALRYSQGVNTETTTTGRRMVEVGLPGNVKGRFMRLRLAGAAEARLFGARVLARVLGGAEGWEWYPVPIEATPDLFSTAQLPIEPTPDGFSEARLPIEPTPDGFAEARLPIEPTPEGWATAALPMRESPELRTWVNLAVPIVE